jgi:hypothetical protein
VLRTRIDLARERKAGGLDRRGNRRYCEADGLAKDREATGRDCERGE